MQLRLVSARIITALVVMTLFGSRALAEEFAIELEIADEVALDADVIAGFLDGSEDGADVSRAVRGIIARTVAEVKLAASDRVSDDGVLTLDDGSTTSVLDGDVLNVKMRKKILIGSCKKKLLNGAYTCGTLSFGFKCTPGACKKNSMGASFINFTVILPDESLVDHCRMSMSLPPTRKVVKGHPGLTCYKGKL